MREIRMSGLTRGRGLPSLLYWLNIGESMTDRNENRPGYKKTIVGWIPKKWEISPAGEVFDIQLGKMLSKKARQGNNPKPYLANYNVQWLSLIHI